MLGPFFFPGQDSFLRLMRIDLTTPHYYSAVPIAGHADEKKAVPVKIADNAFKCHCNLD